MSIVMNQTEAFQILGIEITKEEAAIKKAYREKLTVTNPEDNPEGFKQLRRAYEEACRYAKETEETSNEEKPRDTTPSGLWVERAAEIYKNIRTRRDVELWKELFDEDIFLSLEEEENCRLKLLGYLMEHFKLPTDVWKLLDKKLSIVSDAKNLREKFPANFMHFCISRCERGEDVDFTQFEGPENADYDLFMEYYDRCWQALQDNKDEEAEQYIRNADALGIRHPIMEVSRANLLVKRGRVEEAVALLEEQLERYPKDIMLSYNLAEMLWAQRNEGNENYRKRAGELYQDLKAGNDHHYMANVRLTEWYYEEKQYREAKKCAEKVLASGSDEAFMELLGRVNKEIEGELEARYRENQEWEAALELCWCYLQDGKVSRGIQLALKLEKLLPPEKEAEYNGLLAKLYVEQADYEDSLRKAQCWETSLKEKIEKRKIAEESEENKDRDRLRQAHLIRMQCYHNLGFKDRENFVLAIREGKGILTDSAKDIGVLLEMAQIYMEMEEYEQSLEIVRKLVDEYQVFAAYASSLEVYRRQLNAGGVVRAASQCIRYFPNFAKSYEYLAKVYLDLKRRDDLEKVLADAEKNGIKSVILEAYRYQMDRETMDISILNGRLKAFRKDYFKHVENGELPFYEKGLPILTEYLYNYPDDFMLVERGIFHRAAHHYEEAKEDFEKALYLNPINPYALNGLSFVHKYLGEYEKALFFIKRAILYMDEEMSPVIYTDMGNLYALLGNYEMALAAYKQYECLVGEVGLKWFRDNLAEYSMRAGRLEEAAAIYERFYGKDKWTRYEKLVDLYIAAGRGETARQVLWQWEKELFIGPAFFFWESLRHVLSLNLTDIKREKSLHPACYNSRGWTELIYGDKGGAVKAFGKMLKSAPADSPDEKICDAVFACILCGDDKKGKKYAKRLREWINKEKFSGKNKYYNRRKAFLQMEFLAAYYTKSTEELQKILDREGKCEICHSCTSPLCKEMEGVRVLFLLRMGQVEEARERVRRNLEIQPWDEYMQAIKHVAFGDVL